MDDERKTDISSILTRAKSMGISLFTLEDLKGDDFAHRLAELAE